MDPLNDVVTSLDVDMPIKNQSYNSRDFELQKKHHPEIAPLVTSKDPQVVFEKANELAQSFPEFKVTLSDEKNKVIQCLATTKLMRFKDDVLIKVIADDGQTKVHMRSRSRVGRSDLGKNAERIKTFLDLLEKRLGPETT